jgi:hypothetical protein
MSDNFFWNGTIWKAGQTWLEANGTNNWTFNTSSVLWESGMQYLINSRSTDQAGNVEDPGLGTIFYYDNQAPSLAISEPLNNSYLNELKSISGNCIEFGGSGIDMLEICIRTTNNSNYWSESSSGWVNTETWLQVVDLSMATNEWDYDTRDINWITDTEYTITVRAQDIADNLEVLLPGTSFMYDNTPPTLTISINNGAKYSNSTHVLLNLSSFDSGSGLEAMTLSTDGTTWPGWQAFNSTLNYVLPSGDGDKIVYYKVMDKAGNLAGPIVDTIMLDTTPPHDVKIEINNNSEYVNTELVSLSLSAVDSLSGLGDMSFSYNLMNWTAWEPFDTRVMMELLTDLDDGEITIYYRVRDKANNSAQVKDTIILDTTPPHSLSIEINDGAEETNSTNVTLTMFALDDHSGISQMSFSFDGVTWSSWEVFVNERVITLPTLDGEKTVYLRVMDKVDNIAEPVYDSIILNTTIPGEPEPEKPDDSKDTSDFFQNLNWMGVALLAIIIIIIITIFSAMYLRNRSKKKSVAEEDSEEVEDEE